MYDTAKTNKFENPRDITKENIKFRSIIDHTGTYTYYADQGILNYLRPLCNNEYPINDTQSSSQELSTLPPLEEGEKDILYNVESLFTNIPIKETIDYIIDQMYVQKT